MSKKQLRENARNGHTPKTLRSDDGEPTIKVPRDRNGDFNPELVPKHQRHFNGFDDAIISFIQEGSVLERYRSI